MKPREGEPTTASLTGLSPREQKRRLRRAQRRLRTAGRLRRLRRLLP